MHHPSRSVPAKPSPLPHETPPPTWRQYLWPESQRVPWREQLRVITGAAIGLGGVAWLSHCAAQSWHMPWLWLVAPMGASTVLVFAVSSSPLAQPWPVIVGHAVAAVMGILSTLLVAQTEWAAALAVSSAIGAMYVLRCLHPPAGGTALLMVLSAPLPWSVALFPVAFNAALLVLSGIVYHRLTRHAYPVTSRQAATNRSTP